MFQFFLEDKKADKSKVLDKRAKEMCIRDRCSTAATAGRACIALRFTTAIGTRTATVSTRAATST